MAKSRKRKTADEFVDLDDEPGAPDVVASPDGHPDPVELGKQYLAALGVDVEVTSIVPTLTSHLGTLRRIEQDMSSTAPFLPAAGCPYETQMKVREALQLIRGAVDALSGGLAEAIREDLKRMAKS